VVPRSLSFPPEPDDRVRDKVSPMPEEALFDFAVPDELLQEAVAKQHDKDVVADVAMMPGTGEGKAPSLRGILRTSGYASALVLLTLRGHCAGNLRQRIRPSSATNLEHSFHIHNTGLAAVAFVAPGRPTALGRAPGGIGRPGQPQGGGRGRPLIFSVFGSLMALSPNVWAFAFPLPCSISRHRCQQHGAQLLPLRRVPPLREGAGSSAGTQPERTRCPSRPAS